MRPKSQYASLSSNQFSELEREITALRSTELQIEDPYPLIKTFDLEHYKSIHRFLFSDIYDGAGEFREHDLKKGDSIFTPADELEKYKDVIEQRVSEVLMMKDCPLGGKAQALSRLYGLLNQYHPFPEGNGRTQRQFLTEIGEEIHVTLDWSALQPYEIKYMSISIHNGDYELSDRFFLKITQEDTGQF